MKGKSFHFCPKENGSTIACLLDMFLLIYPSQHVNRNQIILLCNNLFFIYIISFYHIILLFFITTKYLIDWMFLCIFNQNLFIGSLAYVFCYSNIWSDIGIYFKLFIKYFVFNILLKWYFTSIIISQLLKKPEKGRRARETKKGGGGWAWRPGGGSPVLMGGDPEAPALRGVHWRLRERWAELLFLLTVFRTWSCHQAVVLYFCSVRECLYSVNMPGVQEPPGTRVHLCLCGQGRADGGPVHLQPQGCLQQGCPVFELILALLGTSPNCK